VDKTDDVVSTAIASYVTDPNESRKEVRISKSRILTAKSITRIGTWNVRTADATGKLAQIINEMKQYKLTILGISEMRWPGSGKLTSDGVTIVYSGGVQHEKGVGIVMCEEAARAMISWEPISDRIIMVRMRTRFGYTSLIQVYAPTNNASDEDKDEFYERLQNTMELLPRHDLKIVMGDFNAQVGSDNKGWEETMGRECLGDRTDNGDRLLSFCIANKLKVGGSWFKHKIIHKGTWLSPDMKTLNQIDHICVSSRWASSVQDVRVQRGADVSSDHYLVVAKLKIKLKRQGLVTKQEILDIGKLKTPEVQREYQLQLSNRFAALDIEEMMENSLEESNNIEENIIECKWKKFRDTIFCTAKEVVGIRRGKPNEQWISGNTWSAIDERRDLKKVRDQLLSEANEERVREAQMAYSEKDKEVKQRCKRDKKDWLDKKATEAEEAARRNDSKKLYRVIKELSGRRPQIPPIKLSDNTTAKSEKEQTDRWKQHFQTVFSCPPPPITQQFGDHQGSRLDINTQPFTLSEVKTAINKLKVGKAAGADGIQAELLKQNDCVASEMLKLCNHIWSEEVVPLDWRSSIIIPLPKKGDLSDCNNWRGISLLSVPGKVMTTLMLNRMRQAIDSVLREEQAGFRAGRACNDQIFTLRQIIEKVNDKQKPVIVNFIDFKKAFDSVHRPTLWQILKEYGLPDKFIIVLRKLYEGSRCAVKTNGQVGEWFLIESGVRQGCILSPILFAIVIDWIMKQATEGRNVGLRWDDGSQLCDLDFADDVTLVCDSLGNMQDLTTSVELEASKTGLRVNASKCKVMTAGPWNENSDIQLGGSKVEIVTDFCYLGSNVSSNGSCEKEVRMRIGKAGASFGNLNRIWKNQIFTKRTKFRLYETIVLSTLLYGAELWPLTKVTLGKLEAAHHRWQRNILRVSWKDHITNIEIRTRSGMRTIEAILRERRLRWFGHVVRMNNQRPPNKALYWQVQGYKRKQGRPRRNWIDTVSIDFTNMDLSWEEAKEMALNRDVWRNCVARYAGRRGKD